MIVCSRASSDKRLPLWNDPFLFMTDETEEGVKKSGVRQICADLQDSSNEILRGTRKRKLYSSPPMIPSSSWSSTEIAVLRREDPDLFIRMEKDLATLVFEGLPAEKFWDVFAQCTRCKFVAPRHYFPYMHKCATQTMEQSTRIWKEMDDPLKGLRRRHEIENDAPEFPPF